MFEKRFIVFFCLCLVLLSPLSASGSSEADGLSVMQVAHGGSLNHPMEKASQAFAAIINAEMGDKYEVKVFPNGTMYNDDSDTLVEMLQSGAVHVGVESISPFSTSVEELSAMLLPFMFDNDEHISNFFASDSEILNIWKKKLEDKNLVVLCISPRTFRQSINNKRLVKTPADLKGLKFRVMTNPFHKKIWELLGTKPVPMPSSEIYTAIQLGTVVGEDNSISNVYDDRTYEVAEYMTLWNYMGDGEMLVMNKDLYDSFSSKEKEIIAKAADKWKAVFTEANYAFEEKAYREMVDAGIKFHVMTETEKIPFRDMVYPMYEETKKNIGNSEWELFMSAIDDARK